MSPDQARETLTSLFQLASEEALVATIEAVAAECGVQLLQGIPVRQHFEQAKLQRAEELVASWSDENPSEASAMKRAWDALGPKNG